jgi:hypothetical protein
MCLSEHANEIMTRLGWCEQLVGFPRFWSNITSNLALINKIRFDECPRLYVEQPTPLVQVSK